MLLDLEFARISQPELITVKEIKETPKPLPPESLSAFGIAYSIVKTPSHASDEVLDRVISEGQMTLRQLRNEMGIHFQLI